MHRLRSIPLAAFVAVLATIARPAPHGAHAAVYVVVDGPPRILQYAPGAAGTAAPARTIGGPATALVAPDQLTLDTVHGEMQVTDFQGFAVRSYAVSATGDAAPLRALVDGPLSRLGQPRSAVVDTAHDELIVASFTDRILVYPRLANGDVAPLRTIAGPSTGIDNSSLILDAAHDELLVWSTSQSASGTYENRVLTFPRSGDGDLAPTRSFTSSGVAALAEAMSLDAARDELYVACFGGQGICVFPRTASGDVAPLRTIHGPSTGLHNVAGLAFDGRNDRVVALTDAEDGGPAAVLSFPRTADGDVAPLVAITGPALGTSQSWVTVDAAGGLTGGTPDGSRSGLVYALAASPAGNRLYGFVANELTGALTPLPGFPVATGGHGDAAAHSRFLAANAATGRLFAYNAVEGTISGFAIRRATGALTRLPYSPFAAGTTSGNCLALSPLGSTLVLTDHADSFAGLRGFVVGATGVAAAQGSPLPLAAGTLAECGFEPAGRDIYAGGGSNDTFLTGARFDPEDGALMPLDGVPYNAGGPSPRALVIAADRILTAYQHIGSLRAIGRTQGGAADNANGASFASGLADAATGVASPFGVYYVADPTGNRIGAYRSLIAGPKLAWAAVPGSPFAVPAGAPGLLALSDAGGLLVLGNMATRSLATFRADPTTGALSALSAQPANALGASGQLDGLAYLGGNAPAAPAGLRVVAATRTSVTLRWLDRSDDEAAFVLEMRRGAQPFTVARTLAANALTAQIGGLVPGATYTFRLRARNVLGDSATVQTSRTLPH